MRTLASDTLEQQQQNLLVTPKERSRDKAAAANSWKGAEENAKVVDLGCPEARARQCGKSSFEHDTATK